MDLTKRCESDESPGDSSVRPYGSNWRRTQPALLRGLSRLRLGATQRQLDQFRMYYSELLKWNRVVTLISKRDERRFVTQHLLPSLVILSLIPDSVSKIADVGSGAGLPGIPLKIMRPELNLTLVEAKLKKALFLEQIVNKLSLQDVAVVNQRAEDLNFRYPVVVTRALGKLDKTVRICLPLLTLGGILVIFKGPRVDREIGRALPSIEKYGGRLMEVREIVFPITEERGRLVLVSKVSRET